MLKKYTNVELLCIWNKNYRHAGALHCVINAKIKQIRIYSVCFWNAASSAIKNVTLKFFVFPKSILYSMIDCAHDSKCFDNGTYIPV